MKGEQAQVPPLVSIVDRHLDIELETMDEGGEEEEEEEEVVVVVVVCVGGRGLAAKVEERDRFSS